MHRDLVSKKTRREFREYLVGWTLREIEQEFDAADIPCALDYQPQESGQRRSLVEQYYHSLDFTNPADIRKLLMAYENILNTALDNAEGAFLNEDFQENARRHVDRLANWLKRDGYIFQDGKIFPAASVSLLAEIKNKAMEFDASYMASQIRRIEESIETDPALAIGTAKELVETCCKTILNAQRDEFIAFAAELGEEARAKALIGEPGKTDNQDLPTLVKATLKELKLLPEHIPDEAKASKTIKRLLSNLATVTQGLSELRNHYGSGHGKTGRYKGLQPRHAKLAVGAATTLAVFLFETYSEMNNVTQKGA